MSNPTTYFGWQMPEPTDLVTDLPADFEVFGQAVDTDFQDLLGGTTGQVLSKTSATDLDFTWVTANPGDITGVTAGVGISGGGTSGTVTVTNDMATTITAAGDIVVGTGSGTYDNLPIGTTAQVLTADTTVSPYKVKWAAASAGATAVVLARTTFTNVANTGATFQSVFTSSYRNYQIIIDSVRGGNNAVLYLTYCYGSSLQSSGYYGGVLQVKFDATTANIAISNANQVSLSTIYSDAFSTYFIDANTQAGSTTALPMVWTGFQSANQAAVMGASSQAGGTSRIYDGFQLSASSGNIYGNVTIYGVSS